MLSTPIGDVTSSLCLMYDKLDRCRRYFPFVQVEPPQQFLVITPISLENVQVCTIFTYISQEMGLIG